MPVNDFQGNSVINFGSLEMPYTQIIDFKHFYPQNLAVFEQSKTIICREYPQPWSDGAEAFYPVNDEVNQQKFMQYQALSREVPDFYLGGRFGSYQYCKMDVAVRHAMTDFNTYFKK